MSSQQESNKYIKHRRNDLWYQYYPEGYEVVRKLYDIFTCGDELYMYTRYDIMCEGIQNFIDSFIDDFKEKYSIIYKDLKPYRIRILSFYYNNFKDGVHFCTWCRNHPFLLLQHVNIMGVCAIFICAQIYE